MKPIQVEHIPMSRVREALVERGPFETVRKASERNVNKQDFEILTKAVGEERMSSGRVDVSAETEVLRHPKTGDEFRIIDYTVNAVPDPIVYASKPVSSEAIRDLQKCLLEVNAAGIVGTAMNGVKKKVIKKMLADRSRIHEITPQAYGEELVIGNPIDIQAEMETLGCEIASDAIAMIRRIDEKVSFKAMTALTSEESTDKTTPKVEPSLFA